MSSVTTISLITILYRLSITQHLHTSHSQIKTIYRLKLIKLKTRWFKIIKKRSFKIVSVLTLFLKTSEIQGISLQGVRRNTGYITTRWQTKCKVYYYKVADEMQGILLQGGRRNAGYITTRWQKKCRVYYYKVADEMQGILLQGGRRNKGYITTGWQKKYMVYYYRVAEEIQGISLPGSIRNTGYITFYNYGIKGRYIIFVTIYFLKCLSSEDICYVQDTSTSPLVMSLINSYFHSLNSIFTAPSPWIAHQFG